MRNAQRFARGSGVYNCRICERATRSTGRGDNEHVQLCAECFDLAGEENSISDTGDFYVHPKHVLEMIEYIASKGGKTAPWDDIKAKAMASITADAESAA